MFNNILENTRFLVIETDNQVKLTHGLLSDFREELLQKIASKDDYIDNLKTSIENDCFSSLHGMPQENNSEEINAIRAMHIICVNLERMADYCVNIARQTHYLSDIRFIHQYDYRTMFNRIQEGLSCIMPVFEKRQLSGALDICRVEFNLDQLYKQSFDQIMAELRQGRNVENLITALFIFRYLERIGDAMLNVGEALIFSVIGDRIKIRQFEALQKTLSESGFEGTLSDIDFASIWGSRSGCRISKVGDKNPAGFKAQGIFKEGIKKKIAIERQNIQRWQAIQPGLVPRVFGYYEKQATASLLVEFLPGCTLDQLVLTESDKVVGNVLFIFEQTVRELWEHTRKPTPVSTNYMAQLQDRLDAVTQVHPLLYHGPQAIDGLEIPSTRSLMESCARIESEMTAPFSVFIHGDFNANNIVFNHWEEKINYIDLYRSRDFDYVQDASVFLVSHFRMPVFEPRLRHRINEVIAYFYHFFKEFANKHGDQTFQARMALALARSFYTSIRFELNYRFARAMYLRAQFLMEQLVAHQGGEWEEFELRTDILFY